MTPDHNLYLIRTYFKKYFDTLFWDKLRIHIRIQQKTILKDLWMSETKATLLKQMDEEKERIFDILQLLLQKLDLFSTYGVL